MTTVLLVLVGLLVVVGTVLAWALIRVKLVQENMDALQGRLTAQAEQSHTLGEASSIHQRRAQELFAVIEGIEKERDTWARMWRENAVMAGNAQSWLMRDLNRIMALCNIYALRLQKLGDPTARTVSVDPGLAELLAEFSASGRAPATARTVSGEVSLPEVTKPVTEE